MPLGQKPTRRIAQLLHHLLLVGAGQSGEFLDPLKDSVSVSEVCSVLHGLGIQLLTLISSGM